MKRTEFLTVSEDKKLNWVKRWRISRLATEKKKRNVEGLFNTECDYV